MLEGLEQLAGKYPDVISNPRGKGLMCAFDLKNKATRDSFLISLVKGKTFARWLRVKKVSVFAPILS